MNNTTVKTTKDHNIIDMVRTYHNVIPSDICEYLCVTFDTAKKKERVDNEVIHFTQLFLNAECPDVIPNLVDIVKYCKARYKQDNPVSTYYWPEKTALEEFRIKRYNEGDGFGMHVDVGNYHSARRYLAFLFYLNDDFVGGETRFLPNKIIKPKTGSVVVFPPMWMLPHTGLPIEIGTKYIMSTYLHYT